jgi:UDP-N-acetylglucosamine acyltransferase
MSNIHPTAIVYDGASLGDDVDIGPYCIVGPEVILGNNVQLKSHVVIDGFTTVGDATIIFPFSSIGSKTQDLLKASAATPKVSIGANNVIREYVTINSGSQTGITSIGDNCLLMASSHVAHDCLVGNNVILANSAALAGHVVLEDNVRIGGLAAIHQFCRVGSNAILGGVSGLSRDLVPFGMAIGERATLRGLNLIGMRRFGYSSEEIRATQQALSLLFSSGGFLSERYIEVKEKFGEVRTVAKILQFIGDDSKRSYCKLDEDSSQDEE